MVVKEIRLHEQALKGAKGLPPLERADRLYQQADRYKDASETSMIHEVRKLYEHAGEEYIKAGAEDQAANAYEKAGHVLLKLNEESATILAVMDFATAFYLYKRNGDSNGTERMAKEMHKFYDPEDSKLALHKHTAQFFVNTTLRHKEKKPQLNAA